MNIKHKFLAALLAVMITAVPLAGCGSQAEAAAAAASTTAVTTTSVATDSTLSEYFTERDLSGDYDESEATLITLTGSSAETDGSGVTVSGGTITITEEGTYLISGTLEDGQIVVEADDAAKVQIVLDGVSITNDDSACILILSADKVFITLAEGSENTLSDTGATYTQQSSDYTVDGVIFSREDLTINGTGSLTVNAGYQHGIVGKDDLKLVSASITVQAAGKGIAANDSIRIASGSYTVDSADDALHTSNSDEDGKGYIYIADGTFDLSTGDDGIHAATDLIIDGGSILIDQSYEALEGLTITINSGEIDVTASDDAMNASSGSSSEESSSQNSGYVMDDHNGMGGGMMNEIEQDASLTINGGEIVVNAGGDGLDSNGTLTVTGGTVIVNGPTNDGNGALDCGLGATISGGTVIAAGSSGMAETFGADSTQYSILYNFSGTVSAGTTVTLTDADGNEVMSYEAVKDMTSILFSCDAITDGTYTITAGSQFDTVTVSSVSTTGGTGGGMMMGGMQGPGGMQQGQGGQMPQQSQSGQMPQQGQPKF